MSNGAEFDYCFENKTVWRRKVWDAIHHRLSKAGKKPKDAVVLYLAAELDLDRSVAFEHGFRNQNLIAVEKDERVADFLREQKKPVIHSTLEKVVGSWNSELKVDVIMADLCCGITKTSASCCYSMMCRSEFDDAIIMFNLLRGRDPLIEVAKSWASNGSGHRGSVLRRYITEVMLGRSVEETVESAEQTKQYVEELKEKARRFYQAKDSGNYKEALRISQQKIETPAPPLMMVEMESQMKLYSYKSTSGQYFDSIIFKNVLRRCFPDRIKDTQDLMAKDDATARQIAAVLAVRTRRVNLELTRQP